MPNHHTFWVNQKKIIDESLSRGGPLAGCYRQDGILLSPSLVEAYIAFIERPSYIFWSEIYNESILPYQTFLSAWRLADTLVPSVEIMRREGYYPDPEKLKKGIETAVNLRKIEVDTHLLAANNTVIPVM